LDLPLPIDIKQLYTQEDTCLGWLYSNSRPKTYGQKIGNTEYVFILKLYFKHFNE